MPFKNTRTEINIHVRYDDVDQAITDFYKLPRRYELTAYQECSNGDLLDFDVKKIPVPDYDRDCLNRMREGKPAMYSLGIYLQDMCAAGDILPGKYIISVSW